MAKKIKINTVNESLKLNTFWYTVSIKKNKNKNNGVAPSIPALTLSSSNPTIKILIKTPIEGNKINRDNEKIITSGKEKNVVSRINEHARRNNNMFLKLIKNDLS